ncbi:MAG: OmpA family protein [Ignavibacteriales bacterium]|nr:MAG: OmpA family protein [Ignavibacteriales bacterium]
MLKKILGAVFLALIVNSSVYPQLAQDSWSFGFGITYPRLMSMSSATTGAWSGIGNYGGYATLQRNFSEHVALRLQGNYSYMETEGGFRGTQSINLVAADFDLLYYFVPCEDLTPYLAAGFGGILFANDNSPQLQLDVTYLEYQFNLGFGAEWRFSDYWSLRAEGIYHTSSTNKLDGYDDPGEDKGLFGGNSDTYITLSAGVQFYFAKGEPSSLCNLYDGMTVGAPFDESPSLDEIEELLKKYYPCPDPCPEVVVKEPVEVEKTSWILVGVNFDFDETRLKPEYYPTLHPTIQFLNNNPEVRVEIQGHTDNIGTESYNQKLSEGRAASVRDYLVSKGIDPSRMTVKGYGESVPLMNNSTAEDRAFNRRIEFKVIN